MYHIRPTPCCSCATHITAMPCLIRTTYLHSTDAYMDAQPPTHLCLHHSIVAGLASISPASILFRPYIYRTTPTQPHVVLAPPTAQRQCCLHLYKHMIERTLPAYVPHTHTPRPPIILAQHHYQAWPALTTYIVAGLHGAMSAFIPHQPHRQGRHAELQRMVPLNLY
mmetsp:Transcript_41959/g.68067  ORF Transcript_41959/g.68067 Transcript_41959/m.68067 type:complete len:167 (+) Transcript_41959:169-669(+)